MAATGETGAGLGMYQDMSTTELNTLLKQYRWVLTRMPKRHSSRGMLLPADTARARDQIRAIRMVLRLRTRRFGPLKEFKY